MCTVTYIPIQKKVFITHSRDEKSSRTKAIAPKEYFINGHTLLFPRDSVAGGSWIGLNKNGNAAVLLNGGFVNHLQQPAYKKSRGLVFLNILAAEDIYLLYRSIDLSGIEPFTIILSGNHMLHECRWDGHEKYVKQLDSSVPHTWSSVTLYDATTVAKRKTWFNDWLAHHSDPAADEIMQFHLSAGDGDSSNDLRMNRNGLLLTVSITCMEIHHNNSTMQYLDLLDHTHSIEEFSFTKAAAIQ